MMTAIFIVGIATAIVSVGALVCFFFTRKLEKRRRAQLISEAENRLAEARRLSKSVHPSERNQAAAHVGRLLFLRSRRGLNLGDIGTGLKELERIKSMAHLRPAVEIRARRKKPIDSGIPLKDLKAGYSSFMDQPVLPIAEMVGMRFDEPIFDAEALSAPAQLTVTPAPKSAKDGDDERSRRQESRALVFKPEDNRKRRARERNEFAALLNRNGFISDAEVETAIEEGFMKAIVAAD